MSRFSETCRVCLEPRTKRAFLCCWIYIYNLTTYLYLTARSAAERGRRTHCITLSWPMIRGGADGPRACRGGRGFAPGAALRSAQRWTYNSKFVLPPLAARLATHGCGGVT